MPNDTTNSQSSDRILEHIFATEGWPKFTNDPADRGSATKGGITIATLRAFRGRPTTVDDLKALTKDEAALIYRRRFIEAPRFDKIADDLLRFQVVDAGVLSGPARATKWLQEAAGVKADGNLGPGTLAAVNAPGRAHRLGIAFAAIRIRFLGRLIEHDRSQAKWAAGWTNRATSFLDREAERA